MKKTAIQNFNKISFVYLFVKRCLLTFLCFSLLGIAPKVFAQAVVPCNLRVVNNSTFKYTGTGAAPSRWNVSQADTGGTTIDHTAYSYQGTGNFSPQNLNSTGGGTNNSTRQYAVVTNPNTLSPQYANIPTDGMLVINPLQGQNDQYISYTVNGLVPGNTYYVEMKLWNVIDMAMPGACGQWCNWNDQVVVEWDGNGNNAHDGQSVMKWTGTNGTGNWDGYGNQIYNMLKISSGGASTVMTGQVTLASATTGFTIVLKKGNSINPIVLGIDYLKVMGCQKEAINVSGGSNTVCQLTNLTLTAQGIGSAAASYSWYQNGTLMPGRNADTVNIISPATVGAQDVYKAVGDYDNISTTITSRLCCSSVGGTQDEIYRQSFNALPYVCTGGRSGGYADVPNKTANIVEPSYVYSGTSCDGLNDGHYAVVQSSFAGDFWRTRPEVKDHTSAAGSGALFINATGSAGQIFYQSNLSGLCNSTTYEFSLWYASLATGTEIVPNLEFDIYQGATLVATTQSGTIPTNEQWFQASVTFATPSSGTGVYTLKIVNLASGTAGNDLMLDDIVVKKCTPSINVYQNGTTNDTALSVCSNAQVKLVVKTAYDLPLEITGSSSGTVYYQWMSASSPNAADGTWTLLGAPETTGSYLATPSVSIVYYRAKVSATTANASTGLLPKATDCGNDGMTSSFKLTQAGSVTIGSTSPRTQNICFGTAPASDITLVGNTSGVVRWEYSTDKTFTTNVTQASNTTTTFKATDIQALNLAANSTTYFHALVNGCSAGSTITTDSAMIIVIPNSVGGTTASAQTVCYNTAPAADITLSGNVGNVTKWQSSTDITFATGVIDIANTSTTLTKAAIGSLTANTYYRAVVQSGSCATANSAAVLITVTPASVGGTIAPASQNVCSGNTASTDLTLSGNVGSVTKWQSSTDMTFATGVADIANTTTTLTGSSINVTTTTYYRAVVQSGAGCTTVYSTISAVVVTSATRGTLSGNNQTICYQSSPASNLVVTGNTGASTGWEYSTSATFASGITTIGNSSPNTLSTAAIGSLALTTNTYFRAVVGGCVAGTFLRSDSVLITVTPASVGGVTASAQTVCYNTAPAADITLSGNVGNVTKWQSSTDITFATGVTDIANTSTTLTKAAIGSLTANTYYRAVVQSGAGCATANSASVLITVSPASVGGIIAPATQNVCSGSTPTTDLTLSGNTGNVTKWQSSADKLFGSGVTDIADITTTLSKSTIGNVSATTYYRAIVQSGTGCTTANSDTSIIVVTSASRGTLSGNNQTICYQSSPSSNLVVTGNTNNSNGWEYTTDATFATGISTIPNSTANTLTTTDIGTLKLTANTYFRAVVAGCIAGTTLRSDSVLITVTPASVGGVTASAQTVCYNTAPAADITLSGNVGNVTKWQSSTDITFATGVTDIANTSTTLTKAAIGSLTANTYYRAVVQSGAGCVTANSASVLITVTPASVGGTIAPATQNVCSGNTPTTDLTLSGNVGSVTKCQSSTDMTFATGVTDIANTTTTLTKAAIGNLSTTTYYRAAVQSGASCTTVYSTISAVVVTSATRGTLSGNNQTICYQSSPASNLVVTGNTNNSTGWEYTTDATFATGISTIANSSANTLNTTDIGALKLTANTYFRAVVGGCIAGNTLRSDSVLITVTPASVGGLISGMPASQICYGTTPPNDLSLSGNIGNVLRWEYSTDKTFATANIKSITPNISSTTLPKASIGNLMDSTYFRAVVQSGTVAQGCNIAYSDTVLIPVQPISKGGNVTPAVQNICSGLIPTTDLTLTGNTGPVVNWQQSTNANFSGATTIANTSNTLTTTQIGRLTTSTYYRAIVTGCSGTINSDSALIQVNPTPVLTITPPASVCAGLTVDITKPSVTVNSTLPASTQPFQYYKDAALTSTQSNPNAIAVSGNYYIRAITLLGCSDTALIPVSITPLPAQPTANDVAYCQGATASLLTASGANSTFTWYAQLSGGAVVTPLPSTATGGVTLLYYVTQTDANNCESDPRVKVSVRITTNPTASINMPIPYLTYHGTVVTLDGRATGGNILWTSSNQNEIIATPTIQNPAVTPAGNTDGTSPIRITTYTMTVTAAENTLCTATSSVDITVIEHLIIPNSFSPNGDGINDVWHIGNISEFTNAEVSIFNRYGQFVSDQKGGYNIPWDGKLNGQDLPEGTYFYIIKTTPGAKPIAGSISIIR